MIKNIYILSFLVFVVNYSSAQILTSTGAVGNYVISSYPGNFTGYYDGFSLIFRANHNNPVGVATMNVASFGQKNIVNTAGNVLAIDDIKLNQIVTLVYDSPSNRFQMLSTSGNTGGGGGVTGGGTASYLTRWATASTLTTSVIFDDGTNVGIGIAPTTKLQVFATSTVTAAPFTITQIEGTQTATNTGSFSGLNVNPSFTAPGSLNALSGIVATTRNSGTGTINNLYGFYSKTENPSGEITNAYGLYVAAPLNTGTITNTYALATETNAGNVGIGTTAPLARLHMHDGHLKSTQTTSPFLNNISLGGLTSITLDGGSTDVKGSVSSAGSLPSTNVAGFRINFNMAYSTPPVVVAAAAGASVTDLSVVVESVTTTYFNIVMRNSGAAAVTPKVNYIVIE